MKNTIETTTQKAQSHLLVAITFAILSSIFITLAQLCFKLSSNEVTLSSWTSFAFNYKIWLGMVSYFLSFILILPAYKLSELTIIYPITSLCFVWNIILAILLLGELLTPARLIGTLLIVLGSIVISR